MKTKLPTDLQILECIYLMYKEAFVDHNQKEPDRSSKIYVPIDIDAVAKKLQTDSYELFGRLYHHTDHKYHYQHTDGSHVHLFALAVGNDHHCINFPYLAAVLADHRQEHRRNTWSLWLSIVSLVLALAAIIAQVTAG